MFIDINATFFDYRVPLGTRNRKGITLTVYTNATPLRLYRIPLNQLQSYHPLYSMNDSITPEE